MFIVIKKNYYLYSIWHLLALPLTVWAMPQNPLCDLIKNHKDNSHVTDNLQRLAQQNFLLVNQPNPPDNMMPLHYAVFYESVPLTKQLLELGALVNAQDRQGLTPLHYASLLHHDTILGLLLKKNADVNTVNQDGNAPLHLAASCSSIRGIQLLLEHQASTNTPNNIGNTPLHEATVRHDSDNPLRLETLLINGADPTIKNQYGMTPFQLASQHKNYPIMALLLSAGSPLPEESDHILFPMYTANPLIPAIILGNDIPPHCTGLTAQDEFGIPPVVYAAAQGHYHLVQQLICIHHVDPWHPTSHDQTAGDRITIILKSLSTLSNERKKIYQNIMKLLYTPILAALNLAKQDNPHNYLSLLPEALQQRIMHYVAHRPLALPTIITLPAPTTVSTNVLYPCTKKTIKAGVILTTTIVIASLATLLYFWQHPPASPH